MASHLLHYYSICADVHSVQCALLSDANRPDIKEHEGGDMRRPKEISWDEARDIAVGTVLYDDIDEREQYRFIILRGSSCLCAYLGIKIDHPLANCDYNDLPIDCHGGLTFAREGDDEYLPKGYFWYGWDYAHCDDYSYSYNESYMAEFNFNHDWGKKWTVVDVWNDSRSVWFDFARLMKLAEKMPTRQ